MKVTCLECGSDDVEVRVYVKYNKLINDPQGAYDYIDFEWVDLEEIWCN